MTSLGNMIRPNTATIHGVVSTLVSGPTEVITTAEAKTHTRVDHSNDDTYLDTLVVAARQYVERVTRRSIGAQTWDFFWDSFASHIEIPKPPLVSVTTVKYTDEDGTQQTATGTLYTTDADAVPGLVHLAHDQSWPSFRAIPNTIEIRAVVGSATVPKPIEQAMLLLIGHWYENREAIVVGTIASQIPMAVDALLAPYTVY